MDLRRRARQRIGRRFLKVRMENANVRVVDRQFLLTLYMGYGLTRHVLRIVMARPDGPQLGGIRAST